MDRVRIFSDADNTLWDTDTVYARAQIEIARDIDALAASRKLVRMDDRDVLALVREHDQRIAHEHPDHLRYPPVLLARALYAYFGGDCEEEIVGTAVETYERRLRAVPELRPGVREALPDLVSRFGLLSVLTETNKSRCERLVKHYDFEQYIERILCEKKSPETYQRVRDQDRRDVMVGDQPDRDVTYAKEAGFVSVLFPAGFLPFWAASHNAKPDYTISDFRELMSILLAVDV